LGEIGFLSSLMSKGHAICIAVEYTMPAAGCSPLDFFTCHLFLQRAKNASPYMAGIISLTKEKTRQTG
jgi:hypothetical protein